VTPALRRKRRAREQSDGLAHRINARVSSHWSPGRGPVVPARVGFARARPPLVRSASGPGVGQRGPNAGQPQQAQLVSSPRPTPRAPPQVSTTGSGVQAREFPSDTFAARQEVAAPVASLTVWTAVSRRATPAADASILGLRRARGPSDRDGRQRQQRGPPGRHSSTEIAHNTRTFTHSVCASTPNKSLRVGMHYSLARKSAHGKTVLVRCADSRSIQHQRGTMRRRYPYGTDVSPGSFECLDCGYVLVIHDRAELPPCYNASGECRHTKRGWIRFDGTQSEELSPYPSAHDHAVPHN
jgi:hypothetical protein